MTGSRKHIRDIFMLLDTAIKLSLKSRMNTPACIGKAKSIASPGL
jgi:hypothetical protein